MEVPIIIKPARGTDKDRIRERDRLIDDPTPAEFRGRKPAVRNDNLRARGFGLIDQHLPKHPQPHITDGAGERAILHHPSDIQILNDDLTIRLGEPCGELV